MHFALTRKHLRLQVQGGHEPKLLRSRMTSRGNPPPEGEGGHAAEAKSATYRQASQVSPLPQPRTRLRERLPGSRRDRNTMGKLSSRISFFFASFPNLDFTFLLQPAAGTSFGQRNTFGSTQSFGTHISGACGREGNEPATNDCTGRDLSRSARRKCQRRAARPR